MPEKKPSEGRVVSLARKLAHQISCPSPSLLLYSHSNSRRIFFPVNSWLICCSTSQTAYLFLAAFPFLLSHMAGWPTKCFGKFFFVFFVCRRWNNAFVCAPYCILAKQWKLSRRPSMIPYMTISVCAPKAKLVWNTRSDDGRNRLFWFLFMRDTCRFWGFLVMDYLIRKSKRKPMPA